MSEKPDQLAPAETWFAARGWEPFPFQRRVWRAYLDGRSGLIHAATGAGKTQAAWWGPLLEWVAEQGGRGAGERGGRGRPPAVGLRVLWLTPMRALAADTERSLREAVDEAGIPWTVERRTGDTGSGARARQLRTPPTALITTPESLSLLLSQPNAADLFRDLRCVVVDEWHEMLGNKRGVQTELCLARLRRWRPGLRLWGLSATLGNLDQALAVLLGTEKSSAALADYADYKKEKSAESAQSADGSSGLLIQGHMPKEIVIDTLIPERVERFPWAGHMGLKMLPAVAAAVEEGRTALVFTNTRNQAETWYQALLAERPEWAGEIALHHGSLSADNRRWVEDGLRAGQLRGVVATSSLDLGVDFSPVDRVLQIGSPKGVARLLQRAGRSGHQPGATSRVTCVPTHAFELVEAAAARDAMQAGRMEGREPVERPLDLLVQHLVTIALGGGFAPEEMLAEVRSTYAFRDLSDAEWRWALDFVVHGGEALGAYPEYHRVAPVDGRYRVLDKGIATRHRMSIGTIVGESSIAVKYQSGRDLGSIQESFISRLKPGDTFVFAGKKLEFLRVRDMTAWVKPANRLKGIIPAWTGTSLPISPELGAAVRRKLAEARDGRYDGPEMSAVRPVLELQKKWSALPGEDELLVERLESRQGRTKLHHLFVYPFAGKLVHQGLAALAAFRLSRARPATFTLTANDYGFELLADDATGFAALNAETLIPALFSTDNLLEDIAAGLNESEMALRQFREIARVAGLIFQGFPGQPRKARHLQASSSL
ncbi:ligase-associated DNA damage response DEXH box helicase, partial [Promineifilum sp.]|uniref:ligase-associated DNA damage response DEXH box helicase n=1 Tax=Promineifilum sp. TaxID=2664178 RepID=UPI0035ADC4CB